MMRHATKTNSVRRRGLQVVRAFAAQSDVKSLLTLSPPRDFDPYEGHATIRKGASIISTKDKQASRNKFKRMNMVHGSNMENDFTNNRSRLDHRSAVVEAQRCLRCADAPCTNGCPTNIDIKSFIQCISNRNFYGAAKHILSENPIGLSTGAVCPTTDLCAGSCNLHPTEEGAIKIGQLQEYATRTFAQMRVPQIRHPDVKDIDWPIALVGCGPSSLSCATYLARLGYKNVSIYERHENTGGGIQAIDLPEYRLSYDDVRAEISLAEDLGVKIHYGKALGKDYTLESLRADGAMSVFVGIGLNAPKIVGPFQGHTAEQGVWDSKNYLEQVGFHSKPGIGATGKQEMGALPKLDGHVLVLGIGDVAIDCATSAFRCGAKQVTLAFRKGFNDARAVEEVFQWARDDRCEFIPFAEPTNVTIGADGKLESVDMLRYQLEVGGKYTAQNEFSVQADHVITAFGCETSPEDQAALAPLKVNDWGTVDATPEGQTGVPWVWIGGDINGASGMTVEASNDGKNAAWFMHEQLCEQYGEADGVEAASVLPGLYTEIDNVDLSSEICGVKFPNPFGLASAPPTTSCEMIDRAFELGWGFAVTKTYSLDKDMITNVSPRIVSTGIRTGSNPTGFTNIELISEKTAEYWIKGVKELKEKHPDKVVISSIMAGYSKEDWQELAIMTLESGCDMMELNLSCPHGMGERGMGLACGEDADMVRDITRWVVDVVPADMPIFPKMTPNITNIRTIARGAYEGGAAGVTAINTVASIQDLRGGIPWPSVGKEQTLTPGGGSGVFVRPIALRMVSEIARELPDFPILATGGIDSHDTAMNFIRMGASACQISSAIQNQDLTLIEDYITGMKTSMYLTQRPDLVEEGWSGQNPPYARNDKPKATLPDFGDFHLEKVEANLDMNRSKAPGN
jgi:dihydropyrimidine dehydrogenase (NADP+)